MIKNRSESPALSIDDRRISASVVPTAIIGDGDPAPVEALRLDGSSPFLLLCEHAGNAIPIALAGLGLSAEDVNRHIGWDIGAAEVSRRLSALLDAPALLQTYSRLVIDCNRPRHSEGLVPAQSDGTVIAANRDLPAAAIDRRWDAIHRPFHSLASDLLDRRPRSLLITLHSFTPRLRIEPDQERPMHIGLLHGTDDRLARAIASGLDTGDGDWLVAFNAPYAIDDDSDYAIPVHGIGRGIPNVLIEIRQDLIDTAEGQRDWAGRLHAALVGPAVTQLIQDIAA